MTRLSQLAFAGLVLATLAAFAVSQHLKRTPPILLHASVRPTALSPGHGAEGAQTRVRIGFATKRSDEATVTVVDAAGDVVRGLGRRRAHAGVLVRMAWDGRTDAGAVAPDARYRVRVDLLREGRSITVPGVVTVDTRPPPLSIVRVRPGTGDAPVLLPAPRARAVSVRLRDFVTRPAVLLVYRVAGGRARLVARRPGRPGGRVVRWEGEVRGRPAPEGSYVLALRVRDLAGNQASIPAQLPPVPSRVPVALRVIVRYLALGPPLEPGRPGGAVAFTVQASGVRYSWAVRRARGGRLLASGRSAAARLRVPLPRRRFRGGAYVLTVRAGSHRAEVSFRVAGHP